MKTTTTTHPLFGNAYRNGDTVNHSDRFALIYHGNGTDDHHNPLVIVFTRNPETGEPVFQQPRCVCRIPIWLEANHMQLMDDEGMVLWQFRKQIDSGVYAMTHSICVWQGGAERPAWRVKGCDGMIYDAGGDNGMPAACPNCGNAIEPSPF